MGTPSETAELSGVGGALEVDVTTLWVELSLCESLEVGSWVRGRSSGDWKDASLEPRV